MATFKHNTQSEPAEPTKHVAKDSAVHRVTSPSVPRVVDAFVDLLVHLGGKHAFGCTGGAVALLCEALARSSLQVVQCRHESGAAFAATEAYFASGNVSIVFTTSGPSILNALNGLMAARSEGAKVILVSGSTPRRERGRGAFQETSSSTMPSSIFSAGSIFDYAIDLVEPSDLVTASRFLEEGVHRRGGFVAHVAIPSSLQGQPSEPSLTLASTHALPSPRAEDMQIPIERDLDDAVLRERSVDADVRRDDVDERRRRLRLVFLRERVACGDEQHGEEDQLSE